MGDCPFIKFILPFSLMFEILFDTSLYFTATLIQKLLSEIIVSHIIFSNSSLEDYPNGESS